MTDIELINLYHRSNISTVRKATGYSVNKIKRILTEHQIDVADGRAVSLTEQSVQSIVARYEAGETVQQIADTIDGTSSVVLRILKQARMHIRNRSEAKLNKPSHRKKTQEQFIEDAKRVHGDTYDYSKVQYINSNTKVTIICSKHGEFQQRAADHIRGFGCGVCAREITAEKNRQSLELFTQKACEVHGDFYDYSKMQYTNSTTKVTIVCPIHGDFQQTPALHLAGNKCPECARESARCKITYTPEQVLEKSNLVHSSKYTYDYNTLTDQKISVICPVHGEFLQRRDQHLEGHGCPQCHFDTLRTPVSDWKQQALEVHRGRYDYSMIHEMASLSLVVPIICPDHGVFHQKAYTHTYYNSGCPRCAQTTSSYELTIEDFLRDNNIRYEPRVRLNKISKSSLQYELDFWLPDHRIAIEVNGLYWHSELQKPNRLYHLDKHNACKSQGIQLIHIFTHLMDNKLEIVIDRLRSLLGICSTRIYARSCSIQLVDTREAKDFLNRNHLQGYVNSSSKVGLYYKDKLVALMTFGPCRKALGNSKRLSDNEWELLRFACEGDTTVVGGASRLLKNFIQTKSPKRIITYADKCWSSGEFYKTIGFHYTHDSKPSYWYFKGDMVYHRFKFAKHTLSKHLDPFDPKLTEWENMKANGYNRFWDCGNYVFELT